MPMKIGRATTELQDGSSTLSLSEGGTTSNMADIGTIDLAVEQSNDVADIPVNDVHGDPYLDDAGAPCTIGVVGVDAKAYRVATEALGKRLAKMPKGEQERLDWRRSLAAAAVVRWHGWTEKGAAFPLTVANAERLLGASHILEQVEAGVRDHARFFASRSTS